MALTKKLREKIDEKSGGDTILAKNLKAIISKCEEGRQTKRVIEEMLSKINNNK